MKRLLKLALACFASLTLAAPIAVASEAEQGFSAMYVFGDSLSDTGNSHADTGRTAHPPFAPIPNDSYGIGGHHYSNGQTWIEYLAKQIDLINGAKPALRNPAFGNYAYGGARARDYLVDSKPDFSAQVESFLSAHNYQAPPDALYVIQFGGNDLRDALVASSQAETFAIVVEAITFIANNIGLLAGHGAQNFMIVNVPNLGITPGVPDDLRGAVTGLSFIFNMNLAAALAPLPQLGLNVYKLDLFAFTSSVAMDPTAYGFTSLEACLTFGVTEGAFCKDRDQHLFWDAIHPTKAAQKLIGDIAVNQLSD
jgi:phospholipase/lecithinase/hemolysin